MNPTNDHPKEPAAMTHYLIVTADPTDPQETDFYEYAIECPGVTDECRAYRDCLASQEEMDALDDASDDNPIAHGKRHLNIDATWMAETNDCYLATHDHVGDAAAGYFEPGRHAIGWDVGDGTELEIHALEGATQP